MQAGLKFEVHQPTVRTEACVARAAELVAAQALSFCESRGTCKY